MARGSVAVGSDPAAIPPRWHDRSMRQDWRLTSEPTRTTRTAHRVLPPESNEAGTASSTNVVQPLNQCHVVEPQLSVVRSPTLSSHLLVVDHVTGNSRAAAVGRRAGEGSCGDGVEIGSADPAESQAARTARQWCQRAASAPTTDHKVGPFNPGVCCCCCDDCNAAAAAAVEIVVKVLLL